MPSPEKKSLWKRFHHWSTGQNARNIEAGKEEWWSGIDVARSGIGGQIAPARDSMLESGKVVRPEIRASAATALAGPGQLFFCGQAILL
jgi:hypothetical protein